MLKLAVEIPLIIICSLFHSRFVRGLLHGCALCEEVDDPAVTGNVTPSLSDEHGKALQDTPEPNRWADIHAVHAVHVGAKIKFLFRLRSMLNWDYT